jgi:hypothetical protein
MEKALNTYNKRKAWTTVAEISVNNNIAFSKKKKWPKLTNGMKETSGFDNNSKRCNNVLSTKDT